MRPANPLLARTRHLKPLKPLQRTASAPDAAPGETDEPQQRRGQRLRRFVNIADAFVPDLIALDVDLRRRARLLVVSAFILTAIGFFFGTVMSVQGLYPLSSVLVLYIGSLLILANPMLMRIMRSVAVPGFLLCLEAIGIISFQAFNDSGLEDAALLFNLVIPWLAAFLVGPAFGFVFGGLGAAVILGFFVLEHTGYPFPNFSSQEDTWLYFLLCASTVSMLIGYLGWLYEGQTLKNLRDANRDLVKAHAALKVAKQRNERILESITDGFFALNRSWQFTYVNQQAERILGQKRDELLNHNVRNLFQGGLGDRILEKFWLASKHNRAIHFDTYYPPVDRWFAVHVYPYDEGLSVYLSDISDRKEYEEQLIDAKEEAENMARLKSSFLTNMSHEIRTPLAGIIGLADTLTHEIEEPHREFVELIEQSAQRLMDTLCSILDLAQLESGNAACELRRIDVLEEARETVSLLEPLARQSDLSLAVEARTEYTEAVLDRSFLNRILNNLIGNAIKFTETGGVKVYIDGTPDELVIKVVDTGIGIPADFMPHLFEEFRQASSGLQRSHQGSGLGLAITRRLVQEMRGTIDVASTVDGGTTFTLRFPRTSLN